jgi:Galactose oxidase, central domain
MIRRMCGNRVLFYVIALLTLSVFSPMLKAAEPPTTWLQLTSGESPAPRAAGAIAYDPVSRKIVLFGGFDASTHFNDTWTFSGAKWTKISTPKSPSARSNAGMAFDRVTGQLVLFGGFDGANYLNDTWLWNGATSTWTQASPSASPLPATGPSLFQDPINGHVDTFGGYNRTNHYSSSTWQWTGVTWSQIQTSTSPFGRGSAEAVYDPVHKNVVLFGGISDINPINTWTFDGSNWTERSPSRSPEAIMFGGAAFDPALGQVIVFGGWGGPNAHDLNTTWAWNGTTWTLLKPSSSPSTREYVQMAYDQASHQVIVFGGLEIVPNILLNDTWQLVRQ